MNPYLTNPIWIKVQDELKESMCKEVALLRELLSNLIEEEDSLLQKNKDCWDHIIQKRFFLIEDLKRVQYDRNETTSRLKNLAPLEYHEENYEIPLLSDQITTLSNKINKQNSCNQQLSTQMQHLVANTNHLGYPSLSELKLPKKTNVLTTISRDLDD